MNDRFKFRVWYKSIRAYQYEGEYILSEVIDDNDAIIEQCTGLKDKNGKLIYEGDIILVDGDKCPVEWDSENARYNVVGYGEIAYLNYNDIEVIGNIHENADLLGK